MKPRRWPRPADTALDRARAIAREYRDALHTADPDRCAALDRAAGEFGETWLLPAPQYHDRDLVTLSDLAELLGEKRGTVWAWWNRGHIPREQSGLFRVDAVVDALATWRLARRHLDAPRSGDTPNGSTSAVVDDQPLVEWRPADGRCPKPGA